LAESVKSHLHIHYDDVVSAMPDVTMSDNGVLGFDVAMSMSPEAFRAYRFIYEGQLSIKQIFDKPLFIGDLDVLETNSDTASDAFELSPKSISELPLILIVDDSPMITKCFKKMFHHSLSVDVAHDVETGLALFVASLGTKNPYVAVVLDNHIGSSSGVELALEMRMNGDIPTMLLSGSSADDQDKKVLDFLQIPVAGKPLRAEELKGLLLDTIARNKDIETLARLKKERTCMSPPIEPFAH